MLSIALASTFPFPWKPLKSRIEKRGRSRRYSESRSAFLNLWTSTAVRNGWSNACPQVDEHCAALFHFGVERISELALTGCAQLGSVCFEGVAVRVQSVLPSSFRESFEYLAKQTLQAQEVTGQTPQVLFLLLERPRESFRCASAFVGSIFFPPRE